VQTRVEAVADHVLHLVDGAGWWVSRVSTSGDSIVSVSSSVQRFAENLDARGIAQSEIGAQFPLDDFPASREAMRDASAFLIELGDGYADNDPAEEQSLVTAGYTCFMAAGGTGSGFGWMVELYGDPISMSFAGFEPVLRSLVTVAVAGGAQPVGDHPADVHPVEQISVPASRPAPDADR
jgi:hypothetical protein